MDAQLERKHGMTELADNEHLVVYRRRLEGVQTGANS